MGIHNISGSVRMDSTHLGTKSTIATSYLSSVRNTFRLDCPPESTCWSPIVIQGTVVNMFTDDFQTVKKTNFAATNQLKNHNNMYNTYCSALPPH